MKHKNFGTIIFLLVSDGFYGNPQDPRDQELLELMRWTISNANQFFSKLNHEGVWLPMSRAEDAVRHGFSLVAVWRHALNMFLKESHMNSYMEFSLT